MVEKFGRVLEIDLSKKELKKYRLDEEIVKKYIGGSGVAAKLLINMTDKNTDPLGPENVLIFASGIFAGTNVPSSGRHAVVTKSPLTGIFCESDVGGYWGTMVRKAGYDFVLFTGKAEKPVYVWINEGDIEIRDAGHIWGKDTFETDLIVKNETDNRAVTAAIGRAGEKMVSIAGIMHDGAEARAAARCGVGAVMGSKNLKAVVVYGTMDIPVYDKEGLKNSVKAMAKTIRENSKGSTQFGTSEYVELSETLGDLPIKNWSMRNWSDVNKIGGQALAKLNRKNFGCGACFVRCGRVVESYKDKNVMTSGPEYESIGCLGANCLVTDIEAVCKANELCNRYGLDTISTGSVIAFAMELYERGLIDDLVDYPIKWGDGNMLCRLVEEIGECKDGLPAILGQGVKKAASIIGKGSDEYAIHSKGLEFPAHDPRAMASGYLGYATSNRGACHLQAFSHSYETGLTEPSLGLNNDYDRHSDKNKARLVVITQNLMALYDSLKVCKFMTFAGVKVDHLLEWYNLTTGENLTIDELMDKGNEIFNLKRKYNQICGITRKDETIPNRILQENLSGGPIDFDTMLDEYYEARGYTKYGLVVDYFSVNDDQ